VPRFELADAAAADVSEIARFTIERWGKAQAATYIDALEARLRLLAERPQIGRQRNELAGGLRSFRFESHIIYYRAADFGIHVMRVLHQRQDPHRHIE
jgi:toxin ParE1/3/4